MLHIICLINYSTLIIDFCMLPFVPIKWHSNSVCHQIPTVVPNLKHFQNGFSIRKRKKEAQFKESFPELKFSIEKTDLVTSYHQRREGHQQLLLSTREALYICCVYVQYVVCAQQWVKTAAILTLMCVFVASAAIEFSVVG